MLPFPVERVWVGDSETFAYDNFWVFINVSTGEPVKIHNDNLAVIRFVEDYDPIFAGYNVRDYDQHILRANLLDYSPELIKEVNDVIITSDSPIEVYNYFSNRGARWTDIPPLIDLFPDIVNKPSLKMLEGFMGMSIEECSVPWDIDRPLTKSEIEEVFEYCIQDVRATLKLWELRQDYIQSKARLCDLFGVDPLDELKHPMARVAADLLQAEKREYPNEDYVFPEHLNVDNLPDCVFHFADNLDRDEGLITTKNTKGNPHTVLFDFYGCATTVGVGGIHSAVGHLEHVRVKTGKNKGKFKETIGITEPYHEKATKDRVILIQDIGAYYPNTIVKCGYMSRGVPDEMKEMYAECIKQKDIAKANGDKLSEAAYKRFINIISGTYRSKGNKLGDAMQGISLCVTGQLYMLDLIEQMHQESKSVKLIQINTDGWIISVDRNELHIIENIVSKFKALTNYKVDSDLIDEIWQRDVNCYVVRFADGSIKVKQKPVGGYYGKEKNWVARGFAYSNTIIDKAIVDFLVNDIPIKETIDNETDLSRFQIIVQAKKQSYKACYKDCHEVFEVIPEGSRRKKARVIETKRGEQVNMVNRLYATTDKSCGKLMKETHAGNLASFGDTPEHAYVDNANTKMTLEMVDRAWYNALAEKKLRDFLGEQMATNDVKEVAEEKPKATTQRKSSARTKQKPFAERYLEFQALMREAIANTLPTEEIDHINYEYVPTGIYKDMVAECAQACDIVHYVQYKNLDFQGVVAKRNNTNEYAATVHCGLVFSDSTSIDAEQIYHEAYGFGVGTGGNCVSSAQTNALRNAIINGLLAKTVFDDDDVQQANPSPSSKQESRKYVSDDEKRATAARVKEETKDTVNYVQEPAAVALYERIQEALEDDDVLEQLTDKDKKGFSTILDKFYEEDGTPKEEAGHLTLTAKMFTQANTKLDKVGVE